VRLVLRPAFVMVRLPELLGVFLVEEFLLALAKESRRLRFEAVGREGVCGLFLAVRLFGLAWPCEVKDSRVTRVSPMGSCLS
jgi:hypothetical protein